MIRLLRRLLTLLVLIGVGLVFAWSARRAAARPRAAGKRVPERSDDRMVRDRQCNTFVLRSRALVEAQGGEDVFFCSESCRARFLGARAAARADSPVRAGSA